MEKYIPDIYQKSIYKINYESLYSRGIKCLIIDLDNTLAPITLKTPNKKIKDLISSLNKMGFKIIIFSRSLKKTKVFSDALGVDVLFKSFKSLKKFFTKIIADYNLDIENVALIANQMVKDIKCGNLVGITTILVNPIGKKEYFTTYTSRILENIISKKLRENDLFTKGKYYE